MLGLGFAELGVTWRRNLIVYSDMCVYLSDLIGFFVWVLGLKTRIWIVAFFFFSCRTDNDVFWLSGECSSGFGH